MNLSSFYFTCATFRSVKLQTHYHKSR